MASLPESRSHLARRGASVSMTSCGRAFVESAPEGYVKMFKAMNLLGVSRQTILQRVKRGELKAVHVYRGRAKGIRIQVPAAAPDLFEPLKKTEGVV